MELPFIFIAYMDYVIKKAPKRIALKCLKYLVGPDRLELSTNGL